jgi:hypothetical protein
MGRGRCWQASHARLRFRKVQRSGIFGYFLCSSLIWTHVAWQYAIILYPTHPPVQIPSKRQPLLEEEILLGLRNAPGVVPRSQAPSGLIPAPLERQPTILPPRHYPVDFGLIL